MNANACRLFDLAEKSVVGMRDGRNAGRISDIEFDWVTGTVLALIISGRPRYFGIFGRSEELRIPWSAVKLIGVDTILADIEPDFQKPEKRLRGGFWGSLFD